MFKIGFALFVVLILASCGYGWDSVYGYSAEEYTHMIKPMDNLTIIKSIEYPEASKLITYDSAGAQRLLVSAYANTLVKITTNKGVFELLLNPNVTNYSDPSAISYSGYSILNHNFNEYIKTPIIKKKYDYTWLCSDTLYFK